MGENDELTQKSEGEELHAEHDEERGEEQRRPVTEWVVEEELVDREPGDERRKARRWPD